MYRRAIFWTIFNSFKKSSHWTLYQIHSYETEHQVRAEEGTIVERQGENNEPVRVVIVTGAYSFGKI